MSLARALSFANACRGQVRRKVRHNWIGAEVRAPLRLAFAAPIPARPAAVRSRSH